MSNRGSPLPLAIKSLFWDINFESLSWENHHNFIIGRLLQSGDWDSLLWLRSQVGDNEVKRWIVNHKGRGLSPRQLRFWELVLGLDPPMINEWIRAIQKSPWEKRVQH